MHTSFLFCLPFGIWSTVNSRFQDLVFALELVLELVLKIANRICPAIYVHGVRAVTALQRPIPWSVSYSL